MKKLFRLVLTCVAIACSAVGYASPPQTDGDGGVTCNPPCGGMACGPSVCTVCNADGCAHIPARNEQTHS